MPEIINLQPGRLDPAVLKLVYEQPVTLALDEAVYAEIDRGCATVEEILRAGKTVYGINTGFGLLAQTRIDISRLQQLQQNLVLSHCTGTGAEISADITRLILVLKINSLARGYSGISRKTLDMLITFVNHEVMPCIPVKGSVGASGDLAPLAHMAAVFMGIGEVCCRGERLTARAALERIGLPPLVPGPKEGLALLNGTQVSTALALAALFDTEKIFAAAVVCGAMSVDALKGTDTPFDARIQALRGHPGQIRVAEKYRALLDGSEIRTSHIDCDRVQDPYSLRCQPQVMGACLDQMHHVSRTLLTEANAVTDNPLVFPDSAEVLSGGNFHAEPVALAADILALAIAEIGAISERRTALLVDPKMSQLPAFLVADSGLNSGFMIAQVTAAALASENKSLAHPASVDSIPTSANQEDHVSMATFAARRLHDMTGNTGNIVAIELLAAVQGIEFHAPCVTSASLRQVQEKLRQVVAPYDRDRFFAPDITAAKAIIDAGYFLQLVGDIFTEPIHGHP